MAAAVTEPELSRPFDIHGLPPAGRDYVVTATPDECARVARRLALRDLRSLAARVQLTPVAGGGVRISGAFAADLVQDCVVTLAAVPSHVKADIGVTLVREDIGADSEIEVGLDGDDVEALRGDVVDLGEVVVEQLALAIDPYPRAPGAVFSPVEPGGAGRAGPSESPFAVLAKLKSANKSK